MYHRTRFLGALLALGALCMPLAGRAMSEWSDTTNQAEFGGCHADPIYNESFVGKTNLGSRVRSIACMDGSKILTTLPAGTKINVIAKTDGWYKVKTAGGQTGWVGAWLISKTSDSVLSETKPIKTEKIEKVEVIKKTTGSLSGAVAILQTLSLADLYTLKAKLSALITELEKKELTKKEPVASSGSISLYGEPTDDGRVKLRWSLSGMTSPQGFKVVISKEKNPVYPGSDYHYLSEKTATSDVWESLDVGTYYFRVCEYLGGKCGVYSNNLEVTVR